jgi:hypothetical protein
MIDINGDLKMMILKLNAEDKVFAEEIYFLLDWFVRVLVI